MNDQDFRLAYAAKTAIEYGMAVEIMNPYPEKTKEWEEWELTVLCLLGAPSSVRSFTGPVVRVCAWHHDKKQGEAWVSEFILGKPVSHTCCPICQAAVEKDCQAGPPPPL